MCYVHCKVGEVAVKNHHRGSALLAHALQHIRTRIRNSLNCTFLPSSEKNAVATWQNAHGAIVSPPGPGRSFRRDMTRPPSTQNRTITHQSDLR